MAAAGPMGTAPRFPVLVEASEIQAHVRRLAEQIRLDHPAGETLLIVAVLKGALVFLADLIRLLPIPVEIGLLRARSYAGARRSSPPQVLDDVADLDLRGRRVLLLDCVLDSGHTLSALRRMLLAREPASLKTCVLLSKRRRRAEPFVPDYLGLEIPDLFVVGYGLDHRGRWRHLPYIAELPAEMLEGQ